MFPAPERFRFYVSVTVSLCPSHSPVALQSPSPPSPSPPGSQSMHLSLLLSFISISPAQCPSSHHSPVHTVSTHPSQPQSIYLSLYPPQPQLDVSPQLETPLTFPHSGSCVILLFLQNGTLNLRELKWIENHTNGRWQISSSNSAGLKIDIFWYFIRLLLLHSIQYLGS